MSQVTETPSSDTTIRLIGRATTNAFGPFRDNTRRLFGAKAADGFASLPHFRVANGCQFLGQLLLVIRFAALGKHTGAFSVRR